MGFIAPCLVSRAGSRLLVPAHAVAHSLSGFIKGISALRALVLLFIAPAVHSQLPRHIRFYSAFLLTEKFISLLYFGIWRVGVLGAARYSSVLALLQNSSYLFLQASFLHYLDFENH